MIFMDFEKPLEILFGDLEKLKKIAKDSDIDMSEKIKELELKISDKRKEIYSNLTGWQRVSLSRHPNRPYTLDYIKYICSKFIELHGDRNVKDDKAIVGGLGKIEDQTVMIIGHQKGNTTKMRQLRNFGMANPEGYRKALRLMKLAQKFKIPVVTLIDTPGAYPGIEAEERGQAEAIARNLFEMAQLEVPIVCYIIGEGASGGALGIGVGDRVFMLENTWYTVISPESCSSILWRSWNFKEQAAEALKLTADHMKEFGLIDGIVYEPIGGAHSDPENMASLLKNHLLNQINELQQIPIPKLLNQRIDKYNGMGKFIEEPINN
ncbi:MAG: acetyl-CoA carboxylase carboxyltransferase subunit alpha [Saprospiraceae bacterium]|nr:acetyl-CoA carboxylase carboxyltransferase subunit alpha [Saprospiraceae bacterium]